MVVGSKWGNIYADATKISISSISSLHLSPEFQNHISTWMPIHTLYPACPSLNSSFLSLALQTKLPASCYIFIPVKGFILHCPRQTPGATLKSSLSFNLENSISHQILLILPLLYYTSPPPKATLNPVPHHFLSALLPHLPPEWITWCHTSI